MIGTAGDNHDELRGWLCVDWLIRVHTPAWLELAGAKESAAALRALPRLRSAADLAGAHPSLDEARSKAAAARDAAWAAAWDAAGDAAWDAAGAAARDAAWAAAWDAAGDAAWDAAGDAALGRRLGRRRGRRQTKASPYRRVASRIGARIARPTHRSDQR
jgi:hypothetical protein